MSRVKTLPLSLDATLSNLSSLIGPQFICMFLHLYVSSNCIFFSCSPRGVVVSLSSKQHKLGLKSQPRQLVTSLPSCFSFPFGKVNSGNVDVTVAMSSCRLLSTTYSRAKVGMIAGAMHCLALCFTFHLIQIVICFMKSNSDWKQ